MKLSLAMIVKNEEKTLKRCLDSIHKYVDEIIIVDTGSEDNTKRIASKYTSKIFDFKWCDDFSAARNFSFNKCSGDFILWLDADDVVRYGDKLKENIMKAFINPRVGFLLMMYNYEFIEIEGKQTCSCQHLRERIVRKGYLEWKGAIHESLIPIKPQAGAKTDDVWIDHLHMKERIAEHKDRNLRILLKEIEKDPNNPDPRTVYYLANTYLGIRNHEAALRWYHLYVQISEWPDEICQAYTRMANIYRSLKQWDNSINCSMKSMKINPENADPYLGIGITYCTIEDYKKAIYWLEIGLKKPKPTSILVLNPRDYDYNPLLYLAEALLRVGRYKEAFKAFDKCLEFFPENKSLIYKSSIAERLKNIRESAKALDSVVKYAMNNEELLKAENLIENAPVDIRDVPEIRTLRLQIANIMNRIRGYDKGDRKLSQFANPYYDPKDGNLEKEKKYKQLLIELEQNPHIKTILDLGCYNGWMSIDLAKRGYTVTGVDISNESLDIAKQRSKDLTNLTFKKASYKELSQIFDKKFDMVVCFDVMEHVLDPIDFIKNVESVTKEDGKIVINVPNGAWHKGNMDTQCVDLWEHVRAFEVRDIIKLLSGRKNLDIIRLMSEEPRAILSPGQGSLYISYNNQSKLGKKVAIYCAHTPEEWSPLSIKQGIGGSEEAVINVANELYNLGYRVTVYNSCGRNQGIYNGVPYLHWDTFDPLDDWDIVIAWRVPFIIGALLNTKQKYLWLHDVPQQEMFTEEVIDKIDKIFVLSQWHRQCLPNVPDDKIFVTANGVDINMLKPIIEDKSIKRNPYKVVYGSSPDRGLDVLLQLWPEVKKEVPKAELHVYYGWGVFDQIRKSPSALNWKDKVMKLMDQPGVIDHGRLSHEALTKEYASAGVWAYPTYFTEISCITAMKCQLLGVIPVSTRLAALSETIKFHKHTIDGDIKDPKVTEKFTQNLIEVLKNTSYQKSLRESMKQCVKLETFSWKSVATQWSQLFINGL